MKFTDVLAGRRMQEVPPKPVSIDASIYDEVFSGEVDCGTLEEIFTLFNTEHPLYHRGHSLSVSDVVEVQGAPEVVGRIRFYNTSELYEEVDYTDTTKYNNEIAEAREVGRAITTENLANRHIPSHENGCYFCGSVDFQSIEFDITQTQNPDTNTQREKTPAFNTDLSTEYTVPQVRAEVCWLNSRQDSLLIARASMTIAGVYKVSGICVENRSDGLFVAMPAYKFGGEYKDAFHAVSAEAREQMNAAVMTAYEQKLAEQKLAEQQGEQRQNEQEVADEQAQEGQATDQDEAQGQAMGGM